jgi:hypothetical protein
VTSTLTQELAKRGFTHRAPENPNHNGRVILNGCETAIGRITSTEGWLWLRLGCPIDDNGFIDADALADAAAAEELAKQERYNRPYYVALGPDLLSYHETFDGALEAYRKIAHHNHASVGNWVAQDVDFDGLTESEREALEAVAQ